MGEKEILKRAFDTSPDTVYGILVGLLVLAIMSLSWFNYRQQNKLVELNVSTIEVLKDLNTSLLLLKEEGVNLSERLVEHINHTRETISTKLENLNSKHQHHG